MEQLSIQIDNLNNEVYEGVGILAKHVSTTMGPGGHNVIIQTPKGNVITKDGVSVAKAVRSDNPFEEMGISIVREAALNTVREVGDGTTTTILLTASIIAHADIVKNSNINILDLQKQLDIAAAKVITHIETNARVECNTLHDLKCIAEVSANGDKAIAGIISKVVHKVGTYGLVTINEGVGYEDSLDFQIGSVINSGLLGKHLSNSTDGKCFVYEPGVVLMEDEITEIDQLTDILNYGGNMVIIAKSFSASVIAKLHSINNKQVIPLVAPEYGARMVETLEDLAFITGGSVHYVADEGNVTLDNIGECDSISIDKHDTTILGGLGREERNENYNSHVDAVTKAMEDENAPFAKAKLSERLASLNGVSGVITVVGDSSIEVKERIDRYDDALGATRAALRSGMIIGGGNTYYKATSVLSDSIMGESILSRSLKEPIRKLLENLNVDMADVDLSSLCTYSNGHGLNLKTLLVEDLVSEGIVEPVLLATTVIKNAVSVAKTLLTTSLAITR